MVSSGTPEVAAGIVASFEGKPYRVIAPVKFHFGQVPEVHFPSNVLVTDWVPALQVNQMADLAVILEVDA
jgi:UDP:flavonoid glycosyltransferase YjiC (YdhE family)